VLDGGLITRPADTLLTERAADYLSFGPAPAKELVARVCQLPYVPDAVAEHLAMTLLAGHPRFVREDGGVWRLASQPPAAGTTTAFSSHADEISKLTYAVVDVETTGTSVTYGHRITEIAAVIVRDGAVAERFESLVNPERPIPRYITQLTNISWEMVKDAPRFADVCEQLVGFLTGHVFVAHNAAFDWRFVTSEVRRATGRELDGRRLCTVKLARKLLPQLRRRSLDYVTAHYGVDIVARHRAMGDALATAQVLVRLLDDARDRGCSSWHELDRLASSRSARKRRRRYALAMPQPVGVDSTA
jgi:DNA polymerase III subunit epsilon